MEEIHPKSKGEKLIESLKKDDLNKEPHLKITPIKKYNKGDDLIHKIKEEQLLNKKTEIKKGKAIPVDRHGMPIPLNRKNWDMP